MRKSYNMSAYRTSKKIPRDVLEFWLGERTGTDWAHPDEWLDGFSRPYKLTGIKTGNVKDGETEVQVFVQWKKTDKEIEIWYMRGVGAEPWCAVPLKKVNLNSPKYMDWDMLMNASFSH